MNTLFIVGAFLLVLTVVVFIHELGHFLVARWCGVKIKAFSIGFGPEIAGFYDRHGTRWRLAWIPLGGYVKFVDDENSASAASGDGLARLSAEERSGAFQTKSLAQRSAVVAAGPAFNILSALLIYIASFWIFGSFGTAAIVDEVLPNSPAARAGLMTGDRIASIDGAKIERFSDMQRIVSQSVGKPLTFSIERKSQVLTLVITPEIRQITDAIGQKIEVGAVGIKRGVSEQIDHHTHGLLESVRMGVEETAYVSKMVILGLPKLPGAILKVYTGQRQSEIGGAVAIAEMTAHAARSGLASLLGWVAGFSVMLGIMNLLPIPVLDGGHLMFYAIEGIRGRPLDERKQELSFKIGLAILATMMVAAIFSDVMRKLGIG